MGRRESEFDELKRRAEALGLELESTLEVDEQIPAKNGDNTSEGQQDLSPTPQTDAPMRSVDEVISKLEDVMTMNAETGSVRSGSEQATAGSTVNATEAWNRAANRMASAAEDAAASAKDTADHVQKMSARLDDLFNEVQGQKRLTKRAEAFAIAAGAVAVGTGVALAVQGVIVSRRAKNAPPLPVHEVGGTPGGQARTGQQK